MARGDRDAGARAVPALLYVKVHAANLSDTKSAYQVLEGAVDKYPSLKAFSGDAGYRSTAVDFTSKKHISEKIEG